MAEDTGFGRLPQGAKILWERVGESRTLTLGFFFATGSRFDPPGQAGLAHLVEHLVFKGTRAHTASSLARLVDRVGGDLNAWTDREEMAFVCTLPAEAWPVAVEALGELCLYPTFPADEFDREKEVIRSEILSSLEDPEDLSYDTFLAGLSPGDWSRPVAGTEESLASIGLEDCRSWWATFGHPSQLTVAWAGGVDPVDLNGALERVLQTLEARPAPTLPAPARWTPRPRSWTAKAPFSMVQVAASVPIAPVTSLREAAVWQAFSMLWGETMSSRLFQALREQRGLCYSVSSQLVDAEGGWALQMFASCAPENAASLVVALADEWNRLFDEPPGAAEWADGLAALRGGHILAAERSEGRAGRLWRQHQTFGEVWSSDRALGLVAQPCQPAETDAVLASLRSARPSLLVWGKPPKGLVLPWRD